MSLLKVVFAKPPVGKKQFFSKLNGKQLVKKAKV